jgi:hypothetical protein
MTQAYHDVRVDRPIGEVFDFLAEGVNNPRWQPPVVRTAQAGARSARAPPSVRRCATRSASPSRPTTASRSTIAPGSWPWWSPPAVPCAPPSPKR